MIRFYKTPWITKRWHSELTWQIPSGDAIFLTFDDGPHPEVTPWVMEQLNGVGAKATFFCLGRNLKDHAGLAGKLISSGHVVANHTFSHLNGWYTPNWDYQEDIRACDAELMNLGVHNQLFRPPYGRIKKSQISALKNRKIVMWGHLSWDFDSELDIQKSLKKLKTAGPGSILVFHDTAKAFDNLKVLLPEVLSFFSGKGLKFDVIK